MKHYFSVLTLAFLSLSFASTGLAKGSIVTCWHEGLPDGPPAAALELLATLDSNDQETWQATYYLGSDNRKPLKIAHERSQIDHSAYQFPILHVVSTDLDANVYDLTIDVVDQTEGNESFYFFTARGHLKWLGGGIIDIATVPVTCRGQFVALR